MERSREIGFFTNSHITIDLYYLKEVIKAKVYPIEVDLHYKAIYRGKQVEEQVTASKRVRAVYIDISLKNFQNNFKILMGVYG